MSTVNTTWVLELSENIIPKFQSVQTAGTQAGEKIADSMEQVDGGLQKVEKSAGRLGDCFKRIKAIDWYAVSQGVESLSGKLTEVTQPGVEFDAQLHELKAITGATDEQLQKMGDSARNLSKEFGGSGASQLASYQSILSTLGPQIGQNDEALEKMGRNVATLSKTMQGDVKGATDALDNSLIQFKINLTDPMEAAGEMEWMMNVMAAAAQEGSVEVPGISKALSEVGGVAKMSNVSFEETNALIQGMAKGGLEVEKIGVGARNVLLKMAAPVTLGKDATAYLKAYKVDIEKLGDTSIPFVERMKELNKVGHDMNALALIFGTENVQAAQSMLTTIQYQDQLRTKITGTTAAYEMANTTMESWSEKMKRYRAVIDDWKVSLFEATAPIIPFVQGGAQMLSTGADLANIYSGIGPVIRSMGTWLRSTAMAQKLMSAWTAIATAAQWAWNIALDANPIGLVILAIAGLVAMIVVAIKHYDTWGAALLQFLGPIGWVVNGFKSLYDNWESVKAAFRTEGIIGGLQRIGTVLIGSFLTPLKQIASFADGLFGTNWAAGVEKIRQAANLAGDAAKGAPAPTITGNGRTFIGYNPGDGKSATDAKNRARALGYDVDKHSETEIVKFLKDNEKQSKSSIINPASILGAGGGKEKKSHGGTEHKKDDATSVNGNGAGVKSIRVDVKMTNYFNVGKSYGASDSAADQVVSKINDRLRDAITAID